MRVRSFALWWFAHLLTGSVTGVVEKSDLSETRKWLKERAVSGDLIRLHQQELDGVVTCLSGLGYTDEDACVFVGKYLEQRLFWIEWNALGDDGDDLGENPDYRRLGFFRALTLGERTMFFNISPPQT